VETLPVHFAQGSYISCSSSEVIYNLQGGPKIWHIFYALTLSNINQFWNFFTVRIRRKFAIIPSLKILFVIFVIYPFASQSFTYLLTQLLTSYSCRAMQDVVWGSAVLLKEANAISVELKKKVHTTQVSSFLFERSWL